MQPDEIQLLFEYNYWANGRVLQSTSALSFDQLIAPAPVSHGSLRGALAHILAAEQVWRLRCQEGVSPALLSIGEDFPTLKSLVAVWQAEETAMRAYLATLADEDLSGTVRYTNTRGIVFEDILWQLLVHVVNHGTQFRAEAAVVLSGYGHSPGDLDLVHYFRTQTR